MAQYSIKDLEKLSGIQAHTIRIWEKRYHLVVPRRSDTNIRIYSDDDLKRLLNVSILNHNGLKISKIARLNDDNIKQEILKLTSNISSFENQIDNLVLAMVELNEVRFSSVIQDLIANHGLESAFINVVYPFLIKIGVLWQTGNINPAQEHFASNIIKQKLFSSIDNLAINESSEHKFIVFLPEGEFHEIGILLFSYILKANGYQVIYLGQSVPLIDLESVQQSYHAGFLLTSLSTSLQDTTISEYTDILSKTFKKQRIFLTGELAIKSELKRMTNVSVVKSPEHFKEMLRKL